MAHSVDIHVGKKIKALRLDCGLTRKEFAPLIGTKAQQLHKYETAVNRVSASRLWMIAQALDVPVSCFFEGLPT